MKDFVLKPISLTGKAGGSRYLEVTVDGVTLRSAGTSDETETKHIWRQDASMRWSFTSSSFSRVRSHEPRIRVNILGSGNQVGSCAFDLRDLSWDDPIISTVHRRSIPGTDFELEFELGLFPSVTKQIEKEDVKNNIGIALGQDHILIGDITDTEFTLHITIVNLFGTNIVETPVPRKSIYWVKYSIFGVDVETDTFQSLHIPKFPVMRDSFRIQSNMEDLSIFLKSHPLRVQLYCRPYLREGVHRDQAIVVAKSLLTFDSLFSSSLNQQHSAAFLFKVQDPFKVRDPTSMIQPSLKVQLELEVAEKEQAESVVVDIEQAESVQPPKNYSIKVVSFDLDPIDSQDDETDFTSIKVSLSNGRESYISENSFELDSYGQMDLSDVDGLAMNVNGPVVVRCIHAQHPNEILASAEYTPSEGMTQILLIASSGNIRGNINMETKQIASISSQNVHEEKIIYDNMEAKEIASSPSQHTPKAKDVYSIPQAPHHHVTLEKQWFSFRITIDLKSIKGNENITSNVYLQYSYSLFTGSQVVRTRPPIRVDRFTERTIPNGLHYFQFTAALPSLQDASELEPLVVEVWHSDKYSKDAKLGYCALPLDKLLSAEKLYKWNGHTFTSLHSIETQRLKEKRDYPVIQTQSIDTELVFNSFNKSGTKKIATVKCVCLLENLGLVPMVTKEEEMTDEPAPPLETSVAFESNPTDDFEMSKMNQEREWELQLQIKEATRMAELEQEWASREHERISALKIAQEEFKSLEERMQRAIGDAEKRERVLIRSEVDMQRAVDQRMADIEVFQRRAREECDHQLNLFKTQVAQLDGENKHLRTTLNLKNKRLEKVEDEFAVFREKTRQSPEAVLHREIARLEGLNADLQNRLVQEKANTAQQSLAKENVKAQLVHVSKELQRLERSHNTKAERQLDQLRLEYLAREERYILDGDRKQLQDMKSELNELRSATLRMPVYPQQQPHEDVATTSDSSSQLERLQSEKEELLRGGAYGLDHPIIEQLNHHIDLIKSLK